MSQRTSRVDELLREEITRILSREVQDPRLGFVTVTAVEVSPDLRNARVYVSFLGGEAAFEPRVRILNDAAAFVRHELAARHLDLRVLPDLHFAADHSLERAQRIQELLRESAAPAPPEDDSE